MWDFLLYLFPLYLKKAYSQGIYKAYKREAYNDANVKGSIDIKRHILKNIPSTGNIAYTIREYSPDNNLTQLIRHTIEYIKANPFGASILTSDSELNDIINKFVFITNEHYNKNTRQQIIAANLKPIRHPYFTEYTDLQKLCLKILRFEKITFGNEQDKIYGLIFDGAWLWEEYLNTFLKTCGFKHPDNRKGSDRKDIFAGNHKSKVKHFYPDFIKGDFVLDAKYKNMAPNENGEVNIQREDMH